MVKDYSKGKIYKIEGGGFTYIGSTVQKLCNRMTGHRSDFKHGKNCASKEVLCFSDAIITLVELYPCGSEDELRMRERYFYDLIHCVNKRRPWASEAELAESNRIKVKKYDDTHREQKQAYREANREHNKAYSKAYYARKKAEKAEKAETTTI